MSERSNAARVGKVVFVLVAMGSVMAFASVVRDAEQRRAPDALASLLEPSYVGNNRIAPDFELPDKDGHRHKLSSLRGKTVVLHFWTRTCGPCIDELQRSLPAFDELVRGRDDVVLLLVTTDQDWGSIAPLVPTNLTATILFDPERRIVSEKYGTRLFPETWVIDPDGIIRARFDHTMDWENPVLLNFVTELH